jgi:predicted regulator of Ras-like GTPase activity (Roadblock/LC7/MglB family)
MAQRKIDGSKIIHFDATQYEGVKKYLGELYSKTRAKVVLFADMAGQIIAERGDTAEMNTTVLAALAAGDFAATAEIAKLVGEGDRFKLHLHEGETKNVYLTNVGDQFFLIIIFEANVALGMVRVYTKKAVESLVSVVEEAAKNEGFSEEDLIDEDFGNLLAQELDGAFRD